MDETNGPIQPINNGDHRDHGGRFIAGHAHSRRPRNRRSAELRRVALEALDAGTVRDVLLKMAEQAKAGDTTSARIVLEYAIGKPAQAVEVSGPDGEALGADVARLGDAIVSAVAPFGDRARLAVIMAIRGIVDAGPGEPPADPS